MARARMGRLTGGISVLAIALTACQPPNGTTGPTGPGEGRAGGKADGGVVAGANRPAATPTPDGQATPGLGPVPGGTPVPVPTNVPIAVTPVVGNQGARLTGTLRLPATLIGDKGGGIVSNNGGGVLSDWGAGIVSNNGGGLVSNNGGNVLSDWGAGMIGKTKFYRLRALAEQLPVAGAKVTLRDGAGRPVVDASGKPLEGTTDAAGNYRIEGDVPAGRLVAIADLPNGVGQALGFVPGDGAERKADMDVVSTLTTGYILHAYVKTQPDKAATLAKLPEAVEAATRQKAADALAKAEDAVPRLLTTEGVTAAVGALRGQDGAFDSQMEEVRRLLIPAGLFSLGAGHPATDVTLGVIFDVVPLPDGELLINCGGDGRLWRLGKDGKLAVLAGRAGGTRDAVLAGKRATDVTFGAIKHVTRDPSGRLVLVELGATDWTANPSTVAPDRALRIEADGTLTELAQGEPGITLFEPVDADRYVMVTAERKVANPLTYPQPGDAYVTKAWSVVAGTEKRLLHTFEGEDARFLGEEYRYTFTNQPWPRSARTGRDALGRLYAEHDQFGTRSVYRFDPPGFARTTRLVDPDFNAQNFVDAHGNVFAPKNQWIAGKPSPIGMSVLTPDADKPRPLAEGAWPADFKRLQGATLAPDGVAYAHGDGKVFRIAGGGVTRVAGWSEADAKTPADLALPARVAAGKDGGFYVGDPALGRVVRFGPDGKAKVVAGRGAAGSLATYGIREDNDGTTLAVSDIPGAGALAVDEAGTLFIARGREIHRLNPDGQTVLHHAAAGQAGRDANQFVARPNGALVFLDISRPIDIATMVGPMDNRGVALQEIPPGGGTPKVLAAEVPNAPLALGLAPDGSVVLLGGGTLSRWTEATGLVAEASDPRLWVDFAGDIGVDGQGRVYFSDKFKVLRWDPASKQVDVIAGAGGRIFDGVDVDDSLSRPSGVVVAPNGDLLITDRGHRQIKRVPAAKLQP